MRYLLKVTSWAERYRGRQVAEHYYGSIRPEGGEKVDLEHEVEIRDPAYADSSLRCHFAKPGDRMTTIRFKTREEVWAAAREWMRRNARPEDELAEV